MVGLCVLFCRLIEREPVLRAELDCDARSLDDDQQVA
jgi:hypothetical protein